MLSTMNKIDNLLYVCAVSEPSLSFFGRHGFIHCLREDIVSINLITVMKNLPKVLRVAANVMFHSGKSLFDGIEIRAVCGQVYKFDASAFLISVVIRKRYMLLTLLQPWYLHPLLYGFAHYLR
jgi:hypothetical protein